MSIGKAVLLALHIISAGAWMSQFFVEVVLERYAKKMKGQAGAQMIALSEGRASSLLGQVGGVGILITGLGLVGVDGYAILGIGGFTPTWLFIKQVIYLIAMAIVGMVIIRGTRSFEADVAAGRTTEIPSQVVLASRLVNVMVMVNIFLAVWKPM